MPWHTRPQRGEQSRLRRPGCARGSRLNSPRRGEALRTTSSVRTGMREHRHMECRFFTKARAALLLKKRKKEKTHGHFCLKTHLKQSKHCLRPRVLGRRLRLEQSDSDTGGAGPFCRRRATCTHLSG